MLFSPSTLGFYDPKIHGTNVPEDVVDITVQEHQALLAGQASGYRIVANHDGRPELALPLPPTADHLLTVLVSVYEERMRVIASNYPPSERESWPVQMQEAQALLADAQASTPWIDAAAQARGLTRNELATRIAAKNAAYRVVSGTLTGVRQRIEEEIAAAGTDPEALAAIDVNAGWPAL